MGGIDPWTFVVSRWPQLFLRKPNSTFGWPIRLVELVPFGAALPAHLLATVAAEICGVERVLILPTRGDPPKLLE